MVTVNVAYEYIKAKALYLVLFQGPLLFTWFTTLDRVIKGTGSVKVLKMVLVDQVQIFLFS